MYSCIILTFNFKCHFCFIIHIMALYGRASSSTYSLFLTSGQISHLFAYIPRPVLECVAFSALSCFYTPAPLLAAWLFQPFLASKPRTYHWGVAFFAVFCHLWLISQFAGRRSKRLIFGGTHKVKSS